jgi:hypothetical protein
VVFKDPMPHRTWVRGLDCQSAPAAAWVRGVCRGRRAVVARMASQRMSDPVLRRTATMAAASVRVIIRVSLCGSGSGPLRGRSGV